MKHLTYLLLGLFLFSASALSQVLITGQVRSDKGRAIEYARVLALAPRDSSILSYAFTDARGAYRLSVKTDLPEFVLSVASMEIERQDKRVRNATQSCDFVVREATTTLCEVQVKARKIWGQKDTLNYSVGSFAGKHDVVIADVLKKMPGIEVSLDGLVKYQGKAINKFYIEGLDALQGRYGIATNNISAQDVATVQVLENHQPIKALEDSRPSDQAAINLKLKEGVKGTFGLNAHLGLGYDTRLRRNEELTGMYFAKQRQHIYTLKSNDNGQNVRNELRSFHSSSALPDLQMSDISRASSPSFRTERHYNNNTHAFTANNLFKLKNEAELNTNLIFFHDKERRHGGSRMVYHLGASEQVVEEELVSNAQTNELETELRYNRNKDKGYFNNLLRLQAEWRDDGASVLASSTIDQRLRARYLGAENTTHWIHKGRGDRGFELLWRNGIATQPHKLSVAPGLYADRLNGGRAYSALVQDVSHRAFASSLQMSFLSSLRLWGISINPTVFLQAYHNALDTELGAVALSGTYAPLDDREMHNHTDYTRLVAGIGQELSYKSERLRMNAVLPLFYYYTHVGDRVRTAEEMRDRSLQFSPRFFLAYSPISELELKLNGSIAESLPDLHSLYTGYILGDYRSLGRKQMRMYSMQSQSLGFSLGYKDIFSLLFLGAGINYGHYDSDAISSLIIDSPLSISERLALKHSGESLSLNARASKGFDCLSSTLSLEGQVGRGKGQSLVQNELRSYVNEWASASAKLNCKPFSAMTLSYELSWALHRSRSEGAEWLAPLRKLNHTATIHLDLIKNFSLKLTGEHYYNSAVSRGQHFTLADAGLIYTLGKVRFTLDWTNIFGANTYSTASIGDLVSSYSYYHLRPSAVMLRVRFKLL